MGRQPPARDVAPVVQRLRVQYRKHGRLRFASTRDFQRALERAIRRAGLPIGFSAGFSPHPKISYTNSVPTGAASEAEYFEIGLTRPIDPSAVAVALDQALPAGFDVVDVVIAATSDFNTRLQASRWRLRLRGVSESALADAVDRFLAQPDVRVERMTKKGNKEIPVSNAVVQMSAEPPGVQDQLGAGVECAILHMVVRHASPAVRPDDIVVALRAAAGLPHPDDVLILRLAQGPLDEDSLEIGDPLAPDRSAAVSA